MIVRVLKTFTHFGAEAVLVLQIGGSGGLC